MVLDDTAKGSRRTEDGNRIPLVQRNIFAGINPANEVDETAVLDNTYPDHQNVQASQPQPQYHNVQAPSQQNRNVQFTPPQAPHQNQNVQYPQYSNAQAQPQIQFLPAQNSNVQAPPQQYQNLQFTPPQAPPKMAAPEPHIQNTPPFKNQQLNVPNQQRLGASYDPLPEPSSVKKSTRRRTKSAFPRYAHFVPVVHSPKEKRILERTNLRRLNYINNNSKLMGFSPVKEKEKTPKKVYPRLPVRQAMPTPKTPNYGQYMREEFRTPRPAPPTPNLGFAMKNLYFIPPSLDGNITPDYDLDKFFYCPVVARMYEKIKTRAFLSGLLPVVSAGFKESMVDFLNLHM